MNLLETVDDPESVIASLAGCLRPGGDLVVLVPQSKALFSSLDQGMGHKRRFDEPELRKTLESHGFQIEREHQINKIGALSWWFFGKILHRAKMNRPGLKLWDKTVWFWRRDRFPAALAGPLTGDRGAARSKVSPPLATLENSWLMIRTVTRNL